MQDKQRFIIEFGLCVGSVQTRAEKVKSPPGAAAAAAAVAAAAFRGDSCPVANANRFLARQPDVFVAAGWGHKCSTQPRSGNIPVSVRHCVGKKRLEISGLCSVRGAGRPVGLHGWQFVSDLASWAPAEFQLCGLSLFPPPSFSCCSSPLLLPAFFFFVVFNRS